MLRALCLLVRSYGEEGIREATVAQVEPAQESPDRFDLQHVGALFRTGTNMRVDNLYSRFVRIKINFSDPDSGNNQLASGRQLIDATNNRLGKLGATPDLGCCNRVLDTR